MDNGNKASNAVAVALIASSASRGEIVYSVFVESLCEALTSFCEDCANLSTSQDAEYWGATEEGEEWRVHLTRGDF